MKSICVWIVLLVTAGVWGRGLPTKEDCGDFWALLAGRDVTNALRKVQTKGMVVDASSILQLYDHCLRAEDGIRYRRSGFGLQDSVILPTTESAVPSILLQEPAALTQNRLQQQQEEKISTQRIINKLRQFLNRM